MSSNYLNALSVGNGYDHSGDEVPHDVVHIIGADVQKLSVQLVQHVLLFVVHGDALSVPPDANSSAIIIMIIILIMMIIISI